jgi:hypothetical protein
MTPVPDAIRQATAILSEVARIDRTGLADADLISLVAAEEFAGRFLDTSRAMSAAEVADRSRYELGAAGLSMRHGERKPVNFVEQITRVSQSEASRRIRIGTAIRSRQSLLGEQLPPERPIVAEAMTNGLIGVDAAQAIIYNLKLAAAGSEATPERMDTAELALVDAAVTESADLVADAGRMWRDAMDPDGIEPRYEEIRERRMLTVGRERNGIKRYTINAAPTLSAVLDAALLDSIDPKAQPRFLSEEDRVRAATTVEEIDGTLVEKIVDPRSFEQKQHDVLEGVLTEALRATRTGPPDLRTIGSVTAVINLKDLESGTGYGILEGTDEVLPASAVQEIACDSGFYTVILGRGGEPLHHGLLKRQFTPAQRRAMIARDGDRCIARGCRRRAAASHAHHVIFYSKDGPTDIDNGVLLCPAHHHALHQGAFEITMVDGMPYIRTAAEKRNGDPPKPASRSRLLAAVA